MIKGYKNELRAYQASKRVNANPKTCKVDNEYFGRGETILRSDGTCDYYLYGQRGKAVLASVAYLGLAMGVRK